ncbi:MAG: hypothetical protein JXR37_35320 [Kiritimatiellae bacterium]|nr:hypothetical protein [Kiritimatiellia bacterium]
MTKGAAGTGMMTAIVWLAAALAVLVAEPARGARVPDLVPMPRKYEPTGGTFDLNARPIFIEQGNRQCEIAADEIVRRIKELGGRAGEIRPIGDVTAPGVYVVPVTGAAAGPVVRGLQTRVTADDPGPQGYVLETSGERLLIVGSDNVGALYGAMTLRQMMEPAAGGRVQIAAARVCDRPDYRYRGRMGFHRGLRNWGGKPADYEAGIRWMMHFKINVLSDYQYWLDPRQVSKDQRAFYKRMNDYALERGIYAMRGEDSTYVGCGLDKDRPDFKDWDCIGNAKSGRFYCWSRDTLTRERAERHVDMMKDCGFTMFFLHPIDGGGIEDPELWSHRCARCKARFGDDRWKASAHQFNIWAEVIREKGLNVVFTSPIYPYSAGHASLEDKTEARYARQRRNSVEYWRNLHKVMDPAVIPMIWMGQPDDVKRYRSYFAGRPLCLYAHSIRVLGYFGTWHRQNKTNYTGDTRDIFLLTGGFNGGGLLSMNQLCSCEFAWNTEAAGSELFDGIYYDVERDHTEPKEIIEDWLPRACRATFGREVGDRIAPVYQAAVLPLYIENPGEGIAVANKYRRRAKAGATDPGDTEGGDYVAVAIVDDAARMARQVAATGKAWAALEAAYPYLNTLDPYQRQTFMWFYRRMPLWRLLAKAQHAAKLGAELNKDGQRDAAVAEIQKGLRELEADRAFAARILDQAGKDEDGKSFDALRHRADRIDGKLNLALKSLTTVFRPRPAGASVKVGLYGDYGKGGTKKFLEQFSHVEVSSIGDLSAATLEPFDCVLIFQTRALEESDYFDTLVRYVKEGGRGVLFQHDLCGFGRYPFGERTPFPEVSPYANGRKDLDKVKAVAAHAALPGMKTGDVQTHMYYDHVTPKPGPKGTVIVEDEKGNPVVVVGAAGKGKVIFDGNCNIDHRDKSVALSGFNAVLAQGAVEWFTGVKLVRNGN